MEIIFIMIETSLTVAQGFVVLESCVFTKLIPKYVCYLCNFFIKMLIHKLKHDPNLTAMEVIFQFNLASKYKNLK